MQKRRFLSKAQSMTEYAVVIATVAAALAAMGIFFRAGLQKRLYTLSHELESKPYAPRMTTSNASSSANAIVTETYQEGVVTIISGENTQRHSNETVNFETE